jgi:ribosomal protein L11 methyltransferase
MSEKQNSWFALEISAPVEAEEAIEFALNELGALGTEINNLGRERPTNIVVKGYFNEPVVDEVVDQQVEFALGIYELPADSVQGYVWNGVEHQDWLAEWKKHWRPTEIGRFVIAPPWSNVSTDKIVIRIEPNMAFGTGTHETTQLCLQAISEIYAPEMSLLDVGTGTGILAIAAAKLGGTAILACDTDKDSVRIAIENSLSNGVGDQITFFEGPIDDQTPVHDFVCANLTIDVIGPILPLLLAKTGSILLLSGILFEQESIIRDALQELTIIDIDVQLSGEWISVLIDLRQTSV